MYMYACLGKETNKTDRRRPRWRLLAPRGADTSSHARGCGMKITGDDRFNNFLSKLELTEFTYTNNTYALGRVSVCISASQRMFASQVPDANQEESR